MGINMVYPPIIVDAGPNAGVYPGTGNNLNYLQLVNEDGDEMLLNRNVIDYGQRDYYIGDPYPSNPYKNDNPFYQPYIPYTHPPIDIDSLVNNLPSNKEDLKKIKDLEAKVEKIERELKIKQKIIDLLRDGEVELARHLEEILASL